MRNFDELECRFVQASLEVFVTVEIAVRLFNDDVSLEKEAFEDLLDLEAWGTW